MKYLSMLKGIRKVFNALPEQEQKKIVESITHKSCVRLLEDCREIHYKKIMVVKVSASTVELQKRFIRFMETGKLKLMGEEDILPITLMNILYRDMLSVKTVRDLAEEKYPEYMI